MQSSVECLSSCMWHALPNMARLGRVDKPHTEAQGFDLVKNYSSI